MTTIPKPTVGRIVLVPVQTRRSSPVCEGLQPATIEIRPAIIVRVFDNIVEATGMPLINVRVFSDDANDNLLSEWGTSLHYSQDDHRVGTWHWMPFQLQAAQSQQSVPKPVEVSPARHSALGHTFRDIVTGFEGVCTARIEYLTGCAQLCLNPPMREGKLVDATYFDEIRCMDRDVPRVALVSSTEVGGFQSDCPGRQG